MDFSSAQGDVFLLCFGNGLLRLSGWQRSSGSPAVFWTAISFKGWQQSLASCSYVARLCFNLFLQTLALFCTMTGLCSSRGEKFLLVSREMSQLASGTL